MPFKETSARPNSSDFKCSRHIFVPANFYDLDFTVVPSQPSSGEYVSASAGLGPMTTIAAICVLLNRILVR